ncbi:MAG: glycosyltransferase [Paludibacteraceae bacterium]|nr:glycosyltransferase [Paludibacteraceae bacterium]
MFIKAQLESILPQLSADDEVIISDDASTDNTLQIINDLHDSRIHILHHTPYTKSRFPMDKTTHNFENALMHAKGDYIFLSDQDDIWLPNKIQQMLNALQKADLVVHNCQVVNADLQVINNSYFDHIRVHVGAIQNAIRCTFLGCCMAFRRAVLTAALPFPLQGVAHDQWLGIVAGLKFKIALITEPLILYRRHAYTETNCYGTSQLSRWVQIRYKTFVLLNTIKKALL